LKRGGKTPERVGQAKKGNPNSDLRQERGGNQKPGALGNARRVSKITEREVERNATDPSSIAKCDHSLPKNGGCERPSMENSLQTYNTGVKFNLSEKGRGRKKSCTLELNGGGKNL